jgi:hypothetical protein
MKNQTAVLTSVAFAFAFGLSPVASGACSPIDNSSVTIRQFTNYAPMAGGINGQCGHSATVLPGHRKPMDACKYFLEDYLTGKTNAVMAAVPQKRGSSFMFGGVYRGVALENSINRYYHQQVPCLRVAVGDHYGTGSNNKYKMDIVTRDRISRLTKVVNATRGTLVPLGRIANLPPPYQKIQRNPEAMAPLTNGTSGARSYASLPSQVPVPTARPVRRKKQLSLPAQAPVPTARPDYNPAGNYTFPDDPAIP